jgi:hypothetical protein
MPDRPPGRKRNGPDITPGRSRRRSTTADEAKATVHAPAHSDWYHRLPCHRCRLCGARGCFVFNPDGCRREVHICWRGCDGLPPRLLEHIS